jgi:hypothetical protein
MPCEGEFKKLNKDRMNGGIEKQGGKNFTYQRNEN